jgi:hypothetical protein
MKHHRLSSWRVVESIQKQVLGAMPAAAIGPKKLGRLISLAKTGGAAKIRRYEPAVQTHHRFPHFGDLGSTVRPSAYG